MATPIPGQTTVPMGTILAFALVTNNIPPDWLLCDGSAIPEQYENLIQAIGNNTPNLCGRTLIGTGTPPNPGPQQSDGSYPNFDPSNNWQLAYTGGEYKHDLSIDEMPKHMHLLDTPDFPMPSGIKGMAGDDFPVLVPITVPLPTEAMGGGFSHNNMQPYYAVNYIIYAGQ
jgi:microcystin-dependent protein